MSVDIAKDLSSRTLLNDGTSIPLFGLGAGPGGAFPTNPKPGYNFANSEEAMLFALENGCHLIDTAQGYR